MQLALTQPLCILFPQSLKQWFQVTLLIIWVQTLLSSLSGCDDQLYRLWSQGVCFGELMRTGQGGFHASQTWVKGCCKAFRSKLIYSMQRQSSQTHMQPTMAALLYITLFICNTRPPQRKIFTLPFIDFLCPLLKHWELHLRLSDIHTCCLHSSLSTCILSTSFRLSCSRWLLCLSSRM